MVVFKLHSSSCRLVRMTSSVTKMEIRGYGLLVSRTRLTGAGRKSTTSSRAINIHFNDRCEEPQKVNEMSTSRSREHKGLVQWYEWTHNETREESILLDALSRVEGVNGSALLCPPLGLSHFSNSKTDVMSAALVDETRGQKLSGSCFLCARPRAPTITAAP